MKPSTAYQGAETLCIHMNWMWDAMQPVLPDTYQLQRMPRQDGTAAPTGYGDPLGSRPTSTVP